MIKRKRYYDAHDYKTAVRSAVSANSLNYRDLMLICNKPERTAYKIIAGESVPDDVVILLLRKALLNANKIVPRDLNRIANWIESPARSWSKDNKEPGKAEFVGEVRYKFNKYIYRGTPMSTPAIARASGKTYPVCRWRIKVMGVGDGDDVTGLIDAVWERGRSANK